MITKLENILRLELVFLFSASVTEASKYGQENVDDVCDVRTVRPRGRVSAI